MDFNDDFSRVTISTTISRSKTSSMGQERKGTKTGNVRTLTLPVDLATRIKEKASAIGKTDCIFQHLGKPISAQMFTAPWKRVLKILDLPYRVPYAARHTMASRALEATGNPIAVAQMMGHSSPVMVLTRYGHVITPPELPPI
jgi:integrase